MNDTRMSEAAINASLALRLLLTWSLLATSACAGNPDPPDDLALPDDLETHPDGRMPIQDLYDRYRSLLDHGWQLDIVVQSQPQGREHALPIIALRTPQAGEAVWILSGIHGEETAGPNAIAASIDVIAALGKRRPVVLLPLNNPQGYAHNWRYLNTPTWSPDIDGQSVGDSSHLLPHPDKSKQPGEARSPAASSSEAAAITAYIIEQAQQYPPAYSIDLHEDDLISEGYVYSQGKKGAADPLAALAVEILRQNGIALKMSGETRFGEPIEGGIIGPVTDSSIDELMSAATIIVDGQARPGPGAHTVLVFETPAKDIELQRRVAAHAALLQALAAEIAATHLAATDIEPGDGFIEVTGGPVWYRVAGEGPGVPLLVLHGGPGGTSCRFSLLEPLGQERPVIRYDQLGTGRSGRPDDLSLWTVERFVEELHTVRQRLGLERLHLLGHSWGGALAAAYVLEKGTEGIVSLTLSSPLLSTPQWIADANLLRAQLPEEVQATLTEHEQIGTLESEAYQDASEIFYERHVYGGPKPPDIEACAGAPWNQEIYEYMWGPTEFKATGTLLDFDVTGRLHEIDAPVLFITGEFDEARPETVAGFQQQVPGARLAVLEGVAHYSLGKDPEGYMRILEEFLDAAEAGAEAVRRTE